MTSAAFFARSVDTATLLFGVSGCVMVFAPRVQRAWEERLAREAAAACVEHGGTALVGTDRVVSCLPPLSQRRLP